MKIQSAAFWIATEKYIPEAVASMRSFQQASPDHQQIKTFLARPAGPTKFLPSEFNDIIHLPERRHDHWFLDSTKYFWDILTNLRTAGFENAIYLDTDTHICGSLAPIFQLANRIDFAGAFAPGRRTRKNVIPVPSSFPEINVGVNLFRLNMRTMAFVAEWYVHYVQGIKTYGNNDQASLREVLWENRFEMRTSVLPPEFNFRFGFGGFLRGPCVVLHGRAPDLSAIAKRVNNPVDFRVFRRGELC